LRAGAVDLLVTGGVGFIGSAVVRAAAARGLRVAVLDKLTYAADPARLERWRDGVELVVGDVADGELVRATFARLRPQRVVHCAAETHVDRSIADAAPFVRTNCLGTQTVLDAALRSGVERLVNVSTDEIYGTLEDDDAVFTEATALDPRSPYSASKAAADMLGRAYWRTHGLPVVTVRPCNAFGPWQFPEKLLPVATLKAMAGEPVPVYGDGRNRREWLFVEDCAAGLLAAAERGQPGEAYNLGSGEERSNLELVHAILGLLERPSSLVRFVQDRPGHDYRYRLATDHAEVALGWRAGTPFAQALERTVRWYQENRAWADARLVTWDRLRGGPAAQAPLV